MHQGMGFPLYSGLNTCAQLDTPIRCLHLTPRRPHNDIGDGPAERLPNPYGAHPWPLIQCNEVKFHQITVIIPGGGGLSHPVGQIRKDDSELLQRSSESKEPIPQIKGLCPQRPSGA